MKFTLSQKLYFFFEHVDGEKHNWRIIPYKAAERCKWLILQCTDES